MVTIPAQVKGGSFNGVLPPIWMAGTHVFPSWCIDDPAALTTTATRLYYYPIYLDRVVAFAGARTFNSGAGDNGEVYRVGVYAEATAGGPGALAKDFGEVTLTGAAALRTLASAWTNARPGWYYIAVHADSAFAIYAFRSIVSISSVGYVATYIARGSIGALNPGSAEWATPADGYQFMYVDTAYGALAATAVAPTNSTPAAPAVRLYI